MRRVRVLLLKEWADMFKARIVWATMVITPLIFVGIGLGSLYPLTLARTNEEMRRVDPQESEEILRFAGQLCDGLGPTDCMEAYLGVLMSLMFMMLPSILPGVFAAYSVVGEKTSGTLEPLLATPLTTVELIAGKTLAALLPAVVITWAAFSFYLGGASLMLGSAAFGRLLAPHWMFAIAVTGPLIALASVLVAMLASARVDDARTAQQLSGVVVIPLIGLLVGQSVGKIFVSPMIVYVGSAGLAVLCVLLFALVVQGFDREAILARRR